MIRSILAAAAMAAFPLSAASETIGTITAAIDGAGEATWYAAEDGGESQSFWVGIMPGSLTGASFSIWGNPTQGELAETRNVVVLGATLLPGAEGFAAVATLEYLERGYSAFWSSVEEDPVDLTLETIEAEGDALRVSGSFAGRVFYSDDPAAPGRDRDTARTIEGRFEAVLGRQ